VEGEGEGFEPSRRADPPNGFQDRRKSLQIGSCAAAHQRAHQSRWLTPLSRRPLKASKPAT